MRRVLLFAAFLLLLGLTTATAASFSVQAEDITSFSQPVDIDVPDPVQAAGRLFIIGDEPYGLLTTVAPTGVKGNEKITFVKGAVDLETEERDPSGNNASYWVAWRSAVWPTGLVFNNQKVRLYFDRTSGAGGLLRAGLFSCPSSARSSTVRGTGQCRLLIAASDTDSDIDFGPFTNNVPPGQELRLKIVNGNDDNPGPSIQWGFREQNRSARLVVDPDSCIDPAC